MITTIEQPISLPVDFDVLAAGPEYKYKYKYKYTNSQGEKKELFFDSPPRTRTEYANRGSVLLVGNILYDAVDCYYGMVSCVGKQSKIKIQSETAEWIFESQEEWAFSFIHICEYLLISPSKLREAIHICDKLECSQHYKSYVCQLFIKKTSVLRELQTEHSVFMRYMDIKRLKGERRKEEGWVDKRKKRMVENMNIPTILS